MSFEEDKKTFGIKLENARLLLPKDMQDWSLIMDFIEEETGARYSNITGAGWERGKSFPNISVLKVLCEYLDIEPSYFIDYNEKEKKRKEQKVNGCFKHYWMDN